jgi:molybdopterin-binding protein
VNPPILEVKNLAVSRGSQLVLKIDQLSVAESEILSLIGPNGAGKSTLMLAIAQLIKPDQGAIYFRGQKIHPADALTFRRRIALVLQEPLLLNGSVYDNVAIGLHFRGLPKDDVQQKVETWLERLGIMELRDRSSRQLSGGEAQRVSLARAFTLDPEILLLDEPFSALDAPTRSSLLDDLQSLLAITDITTILVTHDQNEAMRVGGRIAVILDGRLRQIGSPEQIFGEPVDPDVAAFVGVDTIIPGRVVSSTDGQVIVEARGLHLEAVGQSEVGREVFYSLRPEDVTLWMSGELPTSSARNVLKGQVLRLILQGALVRVVVSCESTGQQPLQVMALITKNSAQEMELATGKTVTLTFKASAAHLIPR